MKYCSSQTQGQVEEKNYVLGRCGKTVLSSYKDHLDHGERKNLTMNERTHKWKADL
jgi:hypothetical protein